MSRRGWVLFALALALAALCATARYVWGDALLAGACRQPQSPRCEVARTLYDTSKL